MQRVAVRGFFQQVGRRGQPLFDVGLTADAFFIPGGADGLAGQERRVSAGFLGARLHHPRLDIRDSRWFHGLPPERTLPAA